MKAFFIDTNVILDFLTDRKPFSLSAAKLFDAALSGKVRLFVSTLSFNNTYYDVRKMTSHHYTMSLLKRLESMVEVLDVTKQIVSASLVSDFNDFEDAIQYNTALTVKGITAIVTRNARHFKNSVIAVMNPDEALTHLETTD